MCFICLGWTETSAAMRSPSALLILQDGTGSSTPVELREADMYVLDDRDAYREVTAKLQMKLYITWKPLKKKKKKSGGHNIPITHFLHKDMEEVASIFLLVQALHNIHII